VRENDAGVDVSLEMFILALCEILLIVVRIIASAHSSLHHHRYHQPVAFPAWVCQLGVCFYYWCFLP